MMNSDLVVINLMFMLLCLVGSLSGDVTSSSGDEWMTSFASSFIRPSTSLEYDPNTGEVQFESIRKRLRLRPDEVDFMTRKFDLRALELVYPTSLKEIERQGLCMLGTAVDDSTSSDAGDVIVKIERKEAVTAWLSENKFTKRTYCARDLAKMRNCYEKLTSMEFYTARLVDSKPRFLRFFSDSSLPLISSAASIGISPKRSPQQQSNNVQILTYSHHTNTQDLRSWYLAHRQDDAKANQKLKNILKQMHAALVYLLDHGLVYTDFRPENVLVNLNNKRGSAFLTRLDSTVVVAANKQIDNICLISIEYFPPVYGAQTSSTNVRTMSPTKLIESFLRFETENSANRLLSWQFCLSIYSLVCTDTFNERLRSFSDRSVFSNWKSDNQSFASYLKCNSASGNGKRPSLMTLSSSLASLFDSCLYRKSRNSPLKVPFYRLIEHEWFDEL